MASNIRVVLEVDNKKYIADVKRAEDATTRFATTTEKSLGGIAPKLQQLGDKFSGFAAALATIGFTAAIGNAVRFADSIQDISDATGIAVDRVLGFSNVVALNGGSADAAQKAILRLAATIDDAASGSANAQNAFADVGVSLRDLERLSEQDILAKTIDGLAKIQDSSKRVALAQQLLGKEFRAVNLTGVSAGYTTAVIEARKYQDTITKTAELQNKLDVAFQKLQLSLLKVIEPMAEFIGKMDEKQIAAVVDAVVKLGTALAALAAAGPVIRGIAQIITAVGGSLLLASSAMGAFKVSAGGAIGAVGSLGTTIGKTAESLSQWWRQTPRFAELGGRIASLGKLGSELATRFGFAAAAGQGLAYSFGLAGGTIVRLIPVIGQLVAGFYAVDAALQLLTGRDLKGWLDSAAGSLEDFVRSKAPALANALDAIGAKLGMAPSPSAQRAAQAENEAELKRLQNRAEGVKAAAAAREAEANKIRQVKTELEKFRREQDKVVEGYADAQNALLRQIGFETELIGLSDDEIQRRRIINTLNEETIKTLENLRAQQQELFALAKDDPRGVEAAKARELGKTIERLTAKQQAYTVSLTDEIKIQQATAAAERIRVGALQEANTLENLRAQLLGYSLTELEKFNQALRGEDFKNKTQAEIDQLRQQAIERDRVTGTLNIERTARETNAKLLDLESQIMGRQFTELEKLEALKKQNPEAFARRTEAENAALAAQATQLDETAAKYKALAFARDLQRQGEDFAAGIRDQLNLDQAATESARRRIQVEIDGRNQLEAKVREIQDRYGDEIKLSEELRQQRRKELDEATAAIGRLTEAKRKSVEEDQRVRNTFEFGWNTAFSKYAEDANSAANQAKTYFDTFTRGFEDAIVRFVQTGKLNFRDLANSLIAEFVRIQAKQLALSLFGGGGSGGGNFFGSVLKLFGFANGGNPAMGKPILVGERGPELMIPRNASTIIPNEALGGSSQQVNVTYQIQAVDASSFRSLVARDPEFIFSVTEQGRRSLPMRARR